MAVEAALVTPIIVLMLLGIIEMSFLFRDYAVVTSNSRTGARIASTGADSGPGTCDADPCTPQRAPALAQMAADAIQRAGDAMPEDQIDHIAVYKANDNGYPGNLTSQPSGSDPCGGQANCVIYRWVDSLDRFRYASGSWDSTSVSACFPGTAAAPLDRVGVSLQATHPFVTGIFGSQMKLRSYTVMNFEPLPVDKCKAGAHQ